jgi:hypothetical protein
MSEEKAAPVKEGVLEVNSRPDSVMFVHNFLDEYGLDPYEFRVYAHAVRRTGGKRDGKFFASLSKTAEICQMSVRRVQYSLKFLCEAGFLIQEKRAGRTDQYRLTPASKWANPKDLKSIREAVTGRGQSTKSKVRTVPSDIDFWKFRNWLRNSLDLLGRPGQPRTAASEAGYRGKLGENLNLVFESDRNVQLTESDLIAASYILFKIQGWDSNNQPVFDTPQTNYRGDWQQVLADLRMNT